MQEVTTARGVAPPTTGVVKPDGRPVMPAYFTGERARLWKRYLADAYWLRRVDEIKFAMFITLTEKYIAADKRGEEMNIASQKLLAVTASEIGFDPIARQRMSGEVMGLQQRRKKRGKGSDAGQSAHLSQYA